MNKKNNIADAIASLKAAGAEGVWVVRGAQSVSLDFDADGTGNWQGIQLARPSEMVLVARFPVGDGREPGVEQC